MDDLIIRLRDGVPISGETSVGVELYDIDAAETTMAEAADEIERLKKAAQALLEQWEYFRDETYGNQENAYYTLAKGQWDKWDALAAALKPVTSE